MSSKNCCSPSNDSLKQTFCVREPLTSSIGEPASKQATEQMGLPQSPQPKVGGHHMLLLSTAPISALDGVGADPAAEAALLHGSEAQQDSPQPQDVGLISAEEQEQLRQVQKACDNLKARVWFHIERARQQLRLDDEQGARQHLTKADEALGRGLQTVARLQQLPAVGWEHLAEVRVSTSAARIKELWLWDTLQRNFCSGWESRRVDIGPSKSKQ